MAKFGLEKCQTKQKEVMRQNSKAELSIVSPKLNYFYGLLCLVQQQLSNITECFSCSPK